MWRARRTTALAGALAPAEVSASTARRRQNMAVALYDLTLRRTRGYILLFNTGTGMATQTTRLDADELLHLAVDAAKRDQHEDAIGFLKRAIELKPDHAKAHYFLAAEHAQIGMFDRAVEEMAKSVELDPTLYTAHFQLGLLHLTSGRAAEAIVAWAPLDPLGDGHPLFLFKSGLESMARDEFDACRDYLTRGMAVNNLNPELNTDMQRVLEQLPPSAAAASAATPGAGHVLLSGYHSDDTDK
jgi:tetratricopeptide (TPR) repeat protein